MRAYFALPLLLPPLLYSCSDATGTVLGGDPVGGTAMPTATATSGEGGAGATLLTNPDCLPGGAHATSSWADLYQCYFGPSGTDSCAGSPGNCHGDTGSAGGIVWVCGSSAATCYAGMMGTSFLSPQATKDLTMNGLYSVLCGSPNGSGSMPLGCPPNQTLLSNDFTRLASWIATGAPGP
jgi:hypothetical protein